MKIRKIIIPAALIALALFSSCTPKKAILEDRIKIVNTVFPPYDWTSAIIGMDDSKTTNSLVAKNGLDMHNYQPSTSDIIQISSADIFIYIGGESDAWVKEALKNSTNPNMKILNLMEIIKEKDSLLSEEEDENEYDEHIWLSLRKAKICVEAISQALCKKVPELAENYKKNTDEYIEELDLLDASFKSVITSTPHNTLIFCDRFPFRYLTEDYGLNYSAAFDGCSAETEASFETVARLSKNLNESGVNAVLVLENSDKKIARTVIANAKKPKCDTLVLDSLQSTALHEAFNGKTYIGTMRENLGTIKKALE